MFDTTTAGVPRPVPSGGTDIMQSLYSSTSAAGVSGVYSIDAEKQHLCKCSDGTCDYCQATLPVALLARTPIIIVLLTELRAAGLPDLAVGQFKQWFQSRGVMADAIRAWPADGTEPAPGSPTGLYDRERSMLGRLRRGEVDVMIYDAPFLRMSDRNAFQRRVQEAKRPGFTPHVAIVQCAFTDKFVRHVFWDSTDDVPASPAALEVLRDGFDMDDADDPASATRIWVRAAWVGLCVLCLTKTNTVSVFVSVFVILSLRLCAYVRVCLVQLKDLGIRGLLDIPPQSMLSSAVTSFSFGALHLPPTVYFALTPGASLLLLVLQLLQFVAFHFA